MFMHNGGMDDFAAIKRPLLALLPDDIFHSVRGDTDSEHCFALFLWHLQQEGVELDLTPNMSKQCTDARHIAAALRATIETVYALQNEHCELDQCASLNFCVTDGSSMVASRCRRPSAEDPPSLYIGVGSDFTYKPDEEMWRFQHREGQDRMAIISSEPLTYSTTDWLLVPTGTLLTVEQCAESDYAPHNINVRTESFS